jgi:hypothetical protein
MQEQAPFQSDGTDWNPSTCSLARYLRPIVLESYHVLAPRRALGLQLDFNQPFNYFSHPFP